ncbi:rhomboid family intramembrane serine protease [Pseudooceanicola sp. CBS1P-1]|uniref:Rhomboid family intramembrane serine protease n=1 Tax=Pseudooceanicola albus TaxID=2692189 RepID=A0A6L7G5Y4_9RHOB|nr:MULTISPECIES: rhomboid family intramembrane serine protease [Pseudooceanicola]MBT9384922.1 rhomboid family intramembrane serine protease [Pseudooceanicola endophyticus]MXN18083.1 rhomboid family intramembrane serine protease [Pseudooceanicola albus]
MNDPFQRRPEHPVNPVPPVVVLLFIAIIGIEGIFSLGKAGLVGGPSAVGWRLSALQDYAFFPAFLDYLAQSHDFDPRVLVRFVSYPFIHGSFTQAVIAGVMMLALGKFVGEIMKPVALLVIFFVSAIVGALIFGLVAPPTQPLYGAYPPTYGLIGAYSYILWVTYQRVGERAIAAFRLIGVLMGLQLLFGIFFEVGMGWVAELSGFVTGFALSPLLLPGGFARLRARLQRR